MSAARGEERRDKRSLPASVRPQWHSVFSSLTMRPCVLPPGLQHQLSSLENCLHGVRSHLIVLIIPAGSDTARSLNLITSLSDAKTVNKIRPTLNIVKTHLCPLSTLFIVGVLKNQGKEEKKKRKTGPWDSKKLPRLVRNMLNL